MSKGKGEGLLQCHTKQVQPAMDNQRQLILSYMDAKCIAGIASHGTFIGILQTYPSTTPETHMHMSQIEEGQAPAGGISTLPRAEHLRTKSWPHAWRGSSGP